MKDKQLSLGLKIFFLSIINISVGLILYNIFGDANILPYLIASVIFMPVIIYIYSLKKNEKNIWFYLISHIIVFFIYTILLLYQSIVHSFFYFNFATTFPVLLVGLLIWGVPALIAGFIYKHIFLKKIKAAELETPAGQLINCPPVSNTKTGSDSEPGNTK